TVTSAVSLSAPTNLTIGTVTSTSVALSWGDSSTGETSYLIERKTGAGGTYAQIGSAAAGATSYTDSSAAAGTNYYYRVRAFPSPSTYGPYSAEASTTTYAATPTGVSASDATFFDHVHITWNAAAGAASYQLFRSTTNDSSTAGLLAPSNTTSFDDTGATGGTIYYYFVAAGDSLNRLSPLSTGDAGSRAVDNTPPAAMASNFDYTQSAEPVQISFSENVWPIAANALSVTNVDTGNPVTPNNVTYNSTSNTASWAMPPLGDANYQAILDHTKVHDAAGNALAADVTVNFFVLKGDAN